MKLQLYQIINTHAAVDLKYFHLRANGQLLHFLVVANSFSIDVDGKKESETYSVIYKYNNGYFDGFQTLLLESIKQFLPIMVRIHKQLSIDWYENNLL